MFSEKSSREVSTVSEKTFYDLFVHEQFGFLAFVLVLVFSLKFVFGMSHWLTKPLRRFTQILFSPLMWILEVFALRIVPWEWLLPSDSASLALGGDWQSKLVYVQYEGTDVTEV